MNKQPTAAEQYQSLGLTDPAVYTPAMLLAIKQKWTGLPVDKAVAELRAAVAAVEQAPVPTVPELKAQLILAGVNPCSDADAVLEQKRLKRNAAVNAWRTRNQLQAALDARDLKFAGLRAKRGTKVAVQAESAVA